MEFMTIYIIYRFVQISYLFIFSYIIFFQGVKSVIGIEMCESAVNDAKHNSDLNGKYYV